MSDHRPEQGSPEQDSPEQDSPEQDSPEQDSPEQDSPEQDSPEPAGRPGGRHGREVFYIEGEGAVGGPAEAVLTPMPGSVSGRAVEPAVVPDFRFSRLGPRGPVLSRRARAAVSRAMTAVGRSLDGPVPAGYTYLGQFVDHDLTFDRTEVTLGENVTVADLVQGRSPTLDLDCMYGAGPGDPVSAEFYRADGQHLKVGRTTAVGPGRLRARTGFDLPRRGDGSPGAARRAVIPDHRNDENLAVAQTHLAMIRFHNRVLDDLGSAVPARRRFRRARRTVVLHYQWMLRQDYLTRICDRSVVSDVFRHGRKVHEAGASPFTLPTMPVEFAVAAFRFGHSMIREDYDWNAEFPGDFGALSLLFDFSGTSGFLGGGEQALPSNWIADWRRLYPFATLGRPDLAPPRGLNRAQRIDTLLTPVLRALPAGSFGGEDTEVGTLTSHLAFRNLTRAGMVRLATGQQMAELMRARGVDVPTLTPEQVAGTGEGAVLDALAPADRTRFVRETPLWFYVLREAELNNGRLAGVGARIVAETFHRSMEGSSSSIVRNPTWRPTLGRAGGKFAMTDLLLVAYDGREDLLAPLGD